MHNIETEITKIAPADGWRGQAVVHAEGKERFSKSQWETLLAEPENLFGEMQHSMKSGVSNTITVKYLDIGGRGVKAALKRRRRGWGIREILRSLGAAQAMRNFITAVKMKQYGLPVASPLAAIYHKRFIFCDQGIYISEYVEGTNIYEFLRNMQEDAIERYRTMQYLSGRMAEIFAELHKNNLWHRDAKATNFVVKKDDDGKYSVIITDVDGIKQYFSHSEDRQMQGLRQLAASVMGLPGVTRTDYLRTFERYCDNIGIPKEQRGDIYRRLAQKAQEKYRLKHSKQGR